MSRITKDEDRLFTDAHEAARFVRNLEGRVRFQVMTKAFLPTTPDRGFDVGTCIGVSRKQMEEIIVDTAKHFTARGAKVKLRLTAAQNPRDLAFVAFY